MVLPPKADNLASPRGDRVSNSNISALMEECHTRYGGSFHILDMGWNIQVELVEGNSAN